MGYIIVDGWLVGRARPGCLAAKGGGGVSGWAGMRELWAQALFWARGLAPGWPPRKVGFLLCAVCLLRDTPTP